MFGSHIKIKIKTSATGEVDGVPGDLFSNCQPVSCIFSSRNLYI